MNITMHKTLPLLISFLISFSLNAQEMQSVYKSKINDTSAVYFNAGNFNIDNTGKVDCTNELQKAIDLIESKYKFGIVFIPEGEYLLSNTIYIWRGIRLIGYGNSKPVFKLADNTQAFNADTVKYVFHFTNYKTKPGEPIRDASPGTFYSAISNLQIKLGEGNKDAVAVRSHFAQHCFLGNIDFFIESGMSGVDEVGNEITSCNFIGGQYGIMTKKPSPSWPFLIIDSYFEGQENAAIRTEEAGMTIVRNTFKNTPTVVSVNPDRAEELFITDSYFENISGPAIVISDEYNGRMQANLQNVNCLNVMQVAKFRVSGKITESPSDMFVIKSFTHGNQIIGLDSDPQHITTTDFESVKELPVLPESDILSLPDVKDWVDVTSLGAIGDEEFDNTEILQKAIDAHQVLYFPRGRFRVVKTLKLKPNTVLIGLNPINSQIIVKSNTKFFDTPGAPRAVIESPKGGNNIINGIGIDAGAINRCAVGLKWQSGKNSMVNDVKFVGGHGSNAADGSRLPVYNNNRSGDADRDKKWDNQYWSLWITNGGGGAFKDIWTASTFAQAGIYVSNTSTPGSIYASSIEHHVRNEVIIKNASNWKFYAFQFEEENADGWNALPLLIENSDNLLFANVYLYRSIRMNASYPTGIKTQNCSNIDFRGIHVYGPTIYSFENSLYDASSGIEIRSREIARLVVNGDEENSNNEKEFSLIADGFNFLSGAVSDEQGNIYFCDSRWHSIYKLNTKTNEIKLLLDAPISPTALAFDKSGNLLILSQERWRKYRVYSCNIDKGIESLVELHAQKVDDLTNKTFVFPSHIWRDEHVFMETTTQSFEEYYVSTDGSTLIGKQDDLGRCYSLTSGSVGNKIFVADEFGQKTYEFIIGKNGNLIDGKQLAEEGELDVEVTGEGKLFIAAGELFVHDLKGSLVDKIHVPDRPTNLATGGENKDTLYVLTGSSVYVLNK